jgi:NADPH-dependent 2,4-dienoyl-CoA reductase/sulfur reductase-like enzyme
MKHIVIVGNGISGITAARHIRKKSNFKITVISAESEYFFSRTALMYVYMGHMRFEDTQPYEPYFWKKNRIDLVHDYVTTIDFHKNTLHLQKQGKLQYDDLILAVGSKPNKYGWPGQDLKGVQGMYSKQDLESMEENSRGLKQAVIVGGGLIGVEMAEMFLSRNIQVKFLVREDYFWGGVLPKADATLIEQHMSKHHGLELIKNTELEAIQGDENGRVKSITTKSGDAIECQFVGLTIGVSPNVDFLKDSALEIDRGILVNSDLSTNFPNVYAIGDCAQFKASNGMRRPIEQVWYTGRMMGETVAETVCGNPIDYRPGHWFNSAKFFDVEYQTYGWVWNNLQVDEQEFIWQHPTKERLLHFVFDKESLEFKGINTFGIRLRHEIFDMWLTKKASIEEVLSNLRQANFDPEFFNTYEKDIVAAFNKQFNSNVQLASKKWWRSILK